MNKTVKPHAFELTVDGVVTTLTMPLTIANSMQLRQELGISQPELLAYMDSPDLDVMAVCVWLAKLQAGEKATFKQVADTLSYATEFSVGVPSDDNPEL